MVTNMVVLVIIAKMQKVDKSRLKSQQKKWIHLPGSRHGSQGSRRHVCQGGGWQLCKNEKNMKMMGGGSRLIIIGAHTHLRRDWNDPHP